jgi:hypothetical protein
MRSIIRINLKNHKKIQIHQKVSKMIELKISGTTHPTNQIVINLQKRKNKKIRRMSKQNLIKGKNLILLKKIID